MTDEELQSRIEAGDRPEGSEASAYSRVFNALRKEPPFQLSADFASQITTRLQPAERKSNDLFWLYFGIGGCFVAMIVAVLLTNFKFSMGAFKFISGYPGFVVFAILFVLALQWLDRKVVRKTT